MTTKSRSIKGVGCNSGGCALKAVKLTSVLALTLFQLRILRLFLQ